MYDLSEKIKCWLPIEEIEPQCVVQLGKLSRLDLVYKHLAVMPDVHLGRGASVGTCIPTIGGVIPAAVGVDAGCGMHAVKTSLTKNDLPKDLSKIREELERSIPLSAGNYNNLQKIKSSTQRRIDKLEEYAVDIGRDKVFSKITRTHWSAHLGTLGSGNHFIELVLDENDEVWTFLHSGSRGIGNRITQSHINVAKNLMRKKRLS